MPEQEGRTLLQSAAPMSAAGLRTQVLALGMPRDLTPTHPLAQELRCSRGQAQGVSLRACASRFAGGACGMSGRRRTQQRTVRHSCSCSLHRVLMVALRHRFGRVLVRCMLSRRPLWPHPDKQGPVARAEISPRAQAIGRAVKLRGRTKSLPDRKQIHLFGILSVTQSQCPLPSPPPCSLPARCRRCATNPVL